MMKQFTLCIAMSLAGCGGGGSDFDATVLLQGAGAIAAITGNTKDLRKEWDRSEEASLGSDVEHALPIAYTAFKSLTMGDNLVVSADGRLIASRTGSIFTVTSVSDGQVKGTLDLHQYVTLLAVTDDGTRLLTTGTGSGSSFGVQLVTVSSGATTASVHVGQVIRGAFVGSRAYVLDFGSLTALAEDGSSTQIQIPGGTGTWIAPEPLGTRLWGLMAGASGLPSLFYVDGDASTATLLSGSENRIGSLGVARGGRLIYAGSSEVYVTGDNGADPAPVHRLTGSLGMALAFPALAPDASSFVFTSSDGSSSASPRTSFSYVGVGFSSDAKIPAVLTQGAVVSGIYTRY